MESSSSLVEWRATTDFFLRQTCATMAAAKCGHYFLDRRTQTITLFCPRAYFQGARNTWTDPDLFLCSQLTPAQALEQLRAVLPKPLRLRYKWGINDAAQLPCGFVFLKAKKQFANGRTLISYFEATGAKLMRVTARAIDSTVLQLWPQSPGQLPAPAIWKQIHRRFRTAPAEIHVVDI